jgi:hypothetical protein
MHSALAHALLTNLVDKRIPLGSLCSYCLEQLRLLRLYRLVIHLLPRLT